MKKQIFLMPKVRVCLKNQQAVKDQIGNFINQIIPQYILILIK